MFGCGQRGGMWDVVLCYGMGGLRFKVEYRRVGECKVSTMLCENDSIGRTHSPSYV